MQAVILVGGEGTRLRPLTYSVPKALVPILNRPFMEIMLDHLKKFGINEVIFSLGYDPQPFLNQFPDSSYRGIQLKFVTEQKPLGTAGAVKNVEGYLKENFWVFNGDILTDFPLNKIYQLFNAQNPLPHPLPYGVLALTYVEDPTLYGVIETDPENRILKFTEKPKKAEVKSHYINAGIYYLKKEVLNLIPENQNYSFEKGVFPELLEHGKPLYGFKAQGYWLDIGSPQKYLKANLDALLQQIKLETPARETSPGIWQEQGVKLSPQAEISPPVYLGAGCEIKAGAELTGPLVVGKNCEISENCKLKQSLLWDGVEIAQNCGIENSIIGQGCRLPQGCRLTGAVLGCRLNLPPEFSLKAGEKLRSKEKNIALM